MVSPLPANVLARVRLANLTSLAEQALADAETASAAAANARQMVLNRDPTLNQASTEAATALTQYTSLSALAADYQAALTASTADRAGLHADIAAIYAQLATLTGRTLTTQRVRVLTTAAVLLNGTGTVTCTWTTPYTAANAYVALVPLPEGAINVNTITITAQTAASITFTFKALVALGIGAAFQCQALRVA